MTLRAAAVKSLFAVLVLLAGATAAAPAAFAQHVVTDNEAAKLTLDALTATPRPVLVRRVVYRPVAVRSASRRRDHVAARTVVAVRSASFHSLIRRGGSVTHTGSSHRRRG